jgi:hypothetical protein
VSTLRAVPQHTAPSITLPPDPVIEAYKKDVDRTLLRETLKLTPAQRLQRLQDFVQAMEMGHAELSIPTCAELPPGSRFGGTRPRSSGG